MIVFSLALGIGANTTIFSLVNALLFRPLPVADPARLVRVGSSLEGQDFLPISLPEYRELCDQNQVFDGIAAYTLSELSVTIGDEAKIEWGLCKLFQRSGRTSDTRTSLFAGG